MKKDKVELRAECATKGIPFLSSWTATKLRKALDYDKVKYKSLEGCIRLVIGLTKWEDPTTATIPLSSRANTAFIGVKSAGTTQHSGFTVKMDALFILKNAHFNRIIVCDASCLMLYKSTTLDRTIIQCLKRLVKSPSNIIITEGRNTTINNKNEKLRTFLNGCVAAGTSSATTTTNAGKTKVIIMREYQKKLELEEEMLNQKKEDRHGMDLTLLTGKNIDRRLHALALVVESCDADASSEESADEDSPEVFLQMVEDEDSPFCDRFAESVKLFAAARYNHYCSSTTIASLGNQACLGNKEKLLTLVYVTTASTVRTGITDAFNSRESGLASLIGRNEIKRYIVVQLRSFARNWRSFGKVFPNICLMGRAGSGKTTVGSVLAYVYGKSGIYCTSLFVAATRSDLVAEYIGQTAPKTKAVCTKTLEGVLLIDEAYQLAQGRTGGRDYGQECLAEIVNFLDKHMACSVVIVAGYEREIKEKLFGANEGLNRRFPSKLVLADYSADELCYILLGKLASMSVHELSEGIINYIYTVIRMLNSTTSALLLEGPFVYQGGDMLNFATLLSRKLNSFLDEPSTKQQRDAVDSAAKEFLASKIVEL